MNDFTKEELEDLLSCCYGGMHDDHPVEDYKLRLQVKLQSLIDNYCEHEYAPHSEGGHYVPKCIKCGMKFGDETQ